MGDAVARIPGLGEAPWSDIFSELYRAGYQGDCIIEHEDRDFEKTEDLLRDFDARVAGSRVALAEVTGDALAEPWSLKHGDTVLFTSPKGEPLRVANWRARTFDPARPRRSTARCSSTGLYRGS